MLKEYYFITTILALINLLIFIFKFEEKKIVYLFTLLGVLTTVSCGGYLALALSETLSEAILAKKIYYIGGCFIHPVVFFAVCYLCKLKVPGWLRNILYIYSFVVYCLVLTIGYNEWYYKNPYIETFQDVTILEYSYNFGHVLFNIMMYAFVLVDIILLIYSLYTKSAVPRKSLWAMTIMQVVNVVLFVIGRYLNSAVEIMPLMYVIDGWLILYMHRRATMYSIEDSIISSLGKQDTYGYIMFDRKKNYLGCNEIAKRIIPEIVECNIDMPIKDVPQMDTVLSWVTDAAVEDNKVFEYEVGYRHYRCTVENLWYDEKACGYMIEMQEDTDHWNYLNLLSSYNTDLKKQVEEKTEHISNIQAQILTGMADMMENRDDNTGGHIKRTSDVIRILVDVIQENKLLDLKEQFCRDLVKAAPMHDLGKIGIDDTILRKPGRLTEEEFAIMQTHTVKSEALVESILKGVEEEHFVEVAMNVARHHHEKWSGLGYPDKLKGEEIPLEARIMAVADVYDALVSKRCYKEPMSFEKATEVMLESMGSHFDPQLEQVFLLSRDRLEEYYRNA